MGSPAGKLTLETLRVLQVFLEAPKQPQYGFELAEAAGMPTGSIYPILARLEKARWLESHWEAIDPSKEGRRPRRYYHLTRAGLIGGNNAIAEARKLLTKGEPGEFQRSIDLAKISNVQTST